MINALHLIWIIPLSACIGFSVAAILAATSRAADVTERRENRSDNYMTEVDVE